LKMRGIDRREIDRRVRETAAMLGLEELLKRKPRQLSGGQRQRVALGRAMVRDPKVFLMDEPLSNLDAKLRAQTRTELKRLHERLKATIIYVTHDQVEAMTMGERIVVLKDGIIQQVADPLTIYNRPANRFVAGFIGSPAMNLLEGRLMNDDGKTYFMARADDFRLPVTDGRSPLAVGAQEVTLGVRPEHVRVETGGVPESSPGIPATVDVVEPMGSEMFVYLNVGTINLTARVSPNTLLRPGDKVTASFEAGRLHFFAAGGSRMQAPGQES